MNGSFIQQHPLPFPKIGLSTSFSWVLGNFASHESCGVEMMHVGWDFIVSMFLVD
jgi:hypothetical protein